MQEALCFASKWGLVHVFTDKQPPKLNLNATIQNVNDHNRHEFGRPEHINYVQLYSFWASLFSIHRSILGWPRCMCMKFKPMTGQDFLWLMVKKSKDQDRRVFDVTCTEWDMQHFVKATSTKFWHQDPGKTCSKINRYTNYAHLLIHNALNVLTHLTPITYPIIAYNHITYSSKQKLLWLFHQLKVSINYFQNPSRLHYVCMLSVYKITVNNNHGLN